jgi:hypothetical protein
MSVVSKKDLSWYSHRLRKMSIREILAMRLCRTVRDYFFPFRLLPKNGIQLDVSFFDPAIVQIFFRRFPKIAKHTLNEAESIYQNCIQLFENIYSFEDHIVWEKDFITGRKWPSIPVGRFNYRSATAGDPKYIWELNRHQFLIILGKAYFLSGDERFARKAVELILSWIEQCPPRMGINWSSCIELAIRQLSWVWTLRFLENYPDLTHSTLNRIRDSLYYQTKYILTHLSMYSSANNHLISELMALVIIGHHLRQDSWVKIAQRLFDKYFNEQFHIDGVGTEQSPSYQAHTMEYTLLMILKLRECGKESSEKILKHLQRGAGFLAKILDQHGHIPQIGDGDSGRVLPLGDRYSEYKSLINLTAYLTEANYLIQPDVTADEKTFWLVGPEAFDRLVAKAGSERIFLPCAFPEGGYYVLERQINHSHVKVIFDCGPLALKPMAGHGHADALSFVLYVNGLPFLIDPGTYIYFKDAFWRDYFRGTSAHNTVRIDGQDQSVFGGLFLSIKQAESNCEAWEEGKCVSGVCKGYQRLKPPVIHKRMLTFMGEAGTILRIEDWLKTSGKHDIEQFFHFAPKCFVEDLGKRTYIANCENTEITLKVDARVSSRLVRGDESTPLGWYSSAYGSKELTTTLLSQTHIQGTRLLITDIRIL